MKNLAWNTFKKTGNIDTFMELLEMQNIEKNGLPNVKNLSKENHLESIQKIK